MTHTPAPSLSRYNTPKRALEHNNQDCHPGRATVRCDPPASPLGASLLRDRTLPPIDLATSGAGGRVLYVFPGVLGAVAVVTAETSTVAKGPGPEGGGALAGASKEIS